jgi:hypothetical protein
LHTPPDADNRDEGAEEEISEVPSHSSKATSPHSQYWSEGYDDDAFREEEEISKDITISRNRNRTKCVNNEAMEVFQRLDLERALLCTFVEHVKARGVEGLATSAILAP